mmetsp:Transcript_124117/g.175086  ORF Transcript_124117/g.175086 Transcript_124117/m.175086 type:complete len:256 (-) Transcript_124117:101-868(-)
MRCGLFRLGSVDRVCRRPCETHRSEGGCLLGAAGSLFFLRCLRGSELSKVLRSQLRDHRVRRVKLPTSTFLRPLQCPVCQLLRCTNRRRIWRSPTRSQLRGFGQCGRGTLRLQFCQIFFGDCFIQLCDVPFVPGLACKRGEELLEHVSIIEEDQHSALLARRKSSFRLVSLVVSIIDRAIGWRLLRLHVGIYTLHRLLHRHADHAKARGSVKKQLRRLVLFEDDALHFCLLVVVLLAWWRWGTDACHRSHLGPTF